MPLFCTRGPYGIFGPIAAPAKVTTSPDATTPPSNAVPLTKRAPVSCGPGFPTRIATGIVPEPAAIEPLYVPSGRPAGSIVIFAVNGSEPEAGLTASQFPPDWVEGTRFTLPATDGQVVGRHDVGAHPV